MKGSGTRSVYGLEEYIEVCYGDTYLELRSYLCLEGVNSDESSQGSLNQSRHLLLPQLSGGFFF